MLFRFAVSTVAVALLGACATTAPTSSLVSGSVYQAPSLSNISRIDLIENYTFEERALPEFDGGVLRTSATTLAHNEAAKLPDRTGARINNLGTNDDAKVIYHRTASDTPDGWRDSGEGFEHLQSGLSCPLQINIASENRQFLLQKITQFDNAGRDIGCSLVSTSGDVAITVFASYWPDVTLEEHVNTVAAAIFQNSTVTEQLPIPMVLLGAAEGDNSDPELFSGLEQAEGGGFGVGDINGTPYKNSFWLVKTYDWHVKVFAQYPKDDVTSEIVSAVFFSASHLAVRAKNMAAPTAPGVDV